MNLLPPISNSSSSASTHTSRPVAAYVHVPFCIHRCGYCDFTVIAGRDDLIGSYLTALEMELRQKLSEPNPVQTLFLGGGTPSYLPSSDLQALMTLLQKWFPLLPGAEFSMECNPDGLTEDRVEVMASGGINRVSLGVQSFHQTHLKSLERSHTPDEVQIVVERLRAFGMENLSFDLIFGVPDQTLEEWQQTLSDAVSLSPQHLSAYGLTYEKGTSFWTRLQRDQLRPVAEETEREMYATAMSFLPANGFEQYELSNYARPGFECRHNQMYWQAEPFFGIGPGAAEFLDGSRRKNHQSVVGWIQRLLRGESAIQEVEELDPDLLAREAVMVGLRQTAGIRLARFRSRYHTTPRALAPNEYDRMLAKGLLEETAEFVRLTVEGRFLADTVMSEFF